MYLMSFVLKWFLLMNYRKYKELLQREQYYFFLEI